MRSFFRSIARKIAPTSYPLLQSMAKEPTEDQPLAAAVSRLYNEVHDLQRQLIEVRQDNRRVVELYDLVFERMRDENPLTEDAKAAPAKAPAAKAPAAKAKNPAAKAK